MIVMIQNAAMIETVLRYKMIAMMQNPFMIEMID